MLARRRMRAPGLCWAACAVAIAALAKKLLPKNGKAPTARQTKKLSRASLRSGRQLLDQIEVVAPAPGDEALVASWTGVQEDELTILIDRDQDLGTQLGATSCVGTEPPKV